MSPSTGPTASAVITTGICIVVKLTTGSGISPRGVNIRIKVTANIIPVTATVLVVTRFSAFMLNPPVLVPARRIQDILDLQTRLA
jgi:hypothetical protein